MTRNFKFAWHTYFKGTGKNCYELLQILKCINMLDTFSSTLLLYLWSDTSELTDRELKHIERNVYCNHTDKFLYITKKLG